MEFSDNDKVNNFLNDLQLVAADKVETIESIRNVFKSSAPELTEDIKYGGIVFNQSDTLIGGIFPYTKHISIEFSNGSKLADPEGVLEGKGKHRRHIKIFDISDIKDKKLERYVQEAIQLEN